MIVVRCRVLSLFSSDRAGGELVDLRVVVLPLGLSRAIRARKKKSVRFSFRPINFS